MLKVMYIIDLFNNFLELNYPGQGNVIQLLQLFYKYNNNYHIYTINY